MFFHLLFTLLNWMLLFAWFSFLFLSVYAACICLKSVSESGNVFAGFVSAKSCVVSLNIVLPFLVRTVGEFYFSRIDENYVWKLKEWVPVFP